MLSLPIEKYLQNGFHVRRFDPATGGFVPTSLADLKLGDHFCLFDNADKVVVTDASGGARVHVVTDAPRIEIGVIALVRSEDHGGLFRALDEAIAKQPALMEQEP